MKSPSLKAVTKVTSLAPQFLVVVGRCDLISDPLMIVEGSVFGHSDLISLTSYYPINGAITYKGHEALDPSQNGGVYDRDTALRHQIAHAAITQLVSDIPSNGLNDNKMIEMTAFEEFGLLGRELGHAEDYP